MCVAAERRSTNRLFFSRQVQFPVSLPDCLQVNSQVIEIGLVLISLVKMSMDQVANVLTVDDPVCWNFRSGECRKGGHHVHC